MRASRLGGCARSDNPIEERRGEMLDVDGPVERSDAELVDALRRGEEAALVELWRRHHSATVRISARLVGNADAEDLAQEAFLAMHRAVQRGGGPTIGVRAYLYTIARNIGVRSLRRHAPVAASVPIDELEGFLGEDPFEQHAEHAVIFDSFRGLPPRWQEVLWYFEVEGMGAADVAELLGLTAGGASQLAFRAREGLRQAWIEGHIERISAREECAWVLGRMGAYVRDRATRPVERRIEEHLSTCDECARMANEARHAGLALGSILLVGLFGATALGSGGGDPGGAQGQAQALARLQAQPQAHVTPALVSAGYRPWLKWTALAATAAATAALLMGTLVQGAPTTVVSPTGATEQVKFAPVLRDPQPVKPSNEISAGQPSPSGQERSEVENASAPLGSGATPATPSGSVPSPPPVPAVTPDPPVAMPVPLAGSTAPAALPVDPEPVPAFPPAAPGWVPERSTWAGTAPFAKYSITVTGYMGWQVRAVIDGVEVARGVIGSRQHSLSPLTFVPEKQQQLDDVVVTFEYVTGSTSGGVPLRLRLSELTSIL